MSLLFGGCRYVSVRECFVVTFSRRETYNTTPLDKGLTLTHPLTHSLAHSINQAKNRENNQSIIYTNYLAIIS